MNYTIEHKDNIVIFELKNKTVENNVSTQFKAQMLIVAQPDISALIINLSSVEAMDSSALGALLLANRQLNEHGIPIVIVGIKPYVKSLMNMTKIDALFEFYDTIESACQDLKHREEED